MVEHSIPKGVDLDTLQEILVGWDEVEAADEPQYTTDVEDVTSVSDAVGRQTRFLEEVGVLEPHKQKHQLTEPGRALATALADGDEQRARERARDLLDDWDLTDDVRGVLTGNPMEEDRLVPIVSGLAGQDLDTSRVETGIETLLELYDWAGLLDRDDGQYRLPESEAAAEDGEETTESDEEATGDESEEPVNEGETRSTETAAEAAGATEATEQVSEELEESDGSKGAAPTSEETGPEDDESTPEDGESTDTGESGDETTGPEAEAESGEATDEAATAEVEAADEKATTEAEDATAEVEATEAELQEAVESVPELVATLADTATAAQEAAQEAKEAAEQAQAAAQQAPNGDGAVADGPATEPHAVSLNLDIDAEDLEAIVSGIKEGMASEDE